MPNWCSTGITFYSKNKKELLKLKRKLNKIYNGKPTAENDSGPGWLGDYANTFYPKIGHKKIDCRGVLELYGEENYLAESNGFFSFEIWTRTAWSAKIGMWHKVLEDFYPNTKLAYIAEECGSDYFLMWDEDNLLNCDGYYLDICCPNKSGETVYIDDHGFKNIAAIHAWLDDTLPFSYHKTDDVHSLCRELCDKLAELDNDEYYCTLAKYELVPPEDFNFLRV